MLALVLLSVRCLACRLPWVDTADAHEHASGCPYCGHAWTEAHAHA